MAGVAKKDEDVLQVNSSTKTPADIEAEIAATAEAIGGLETVSGTVEYVSKSESKAKTRTSKSTKSKKPTKTESSKNEKAEKNPTTPVSNEVVSKKVENTTLEKEAEEKEEPKNVKPKKTAKHIKVKQISGKVTATSDIRPRTHKDVASKAKHADIQTPDDSAPSAVKVSVTPKDAVKRKETTAPNKESKRESAEDVKVEDEVEKTIILNHKGKTVLPPSRSTKSADEEDEEPKAPEPKKAAVAVTTNVKVKPREEEATEKEKTEESRPQPKHEKLDKPYDEIEDEPEIEEVEEAPVEPTKTTPRQPEPEKVTKKYSEANKPKPQKKHTPHVARIYDTTTYHMPISVDKHHRKAMMPLWAQIVLLLVAILAAGLLGFVFNVFNF